MSGRTRWLDERDETLARKAALAPLAAAAGVYGSIAALHRAAYRRGWIVPTRLGCRVVSVGSLTSGGSGKTPLAAWLAASLRRRGHRVVLASRGYGRRGRQPVEVVSDGVHLRSSVERAGDEPLLLAAHAPGVPVLVGPDRAVVGLRAVAAFGAQVLVLDDGFQHHHLARDLEIVAFDGGAGLGNHHVLPRGPLREPLGAVSRADALFIVDGPLRNADQVLLERRCPRARRFEARRVATGVRALAGGVEEPPERLRGRQLGLVSGIGTPSAFRRTVEALGAVVVEERRFRDHHVFRPGDLEELPASVPLWLTTEKDALKILPEWAKERDLRVLRIELGVKGSDAAIDWVEDRLRAKPKRRIAAAPRLLRATPR